MPSQAWIQESLCRLEDLEQERAEHEASLETTNDAPALRYHSEQIDRLDDAIRNLYRVLETAAESGSQDDADEADESVSRTGEFSRPHIPNVARRDTGAYGSVPFAAATSSAATSNHGWSQPLDDDDDPFGTPRSRSRPPSSRLPVGSGAPANSFPTPVRLATPAFDDDDSYETYDSSDEPRGSTGTGKWVAVTTIAAIVLIGGGFVALRSPAESQTGVAAPQPAGLPQVISATPVPPDTQGPQTPVSVQVDGLPSAAIDDAPRPKSGPETHPTRSHEPQNPAPEAEDHKLKIQKAGKNPLTGMQ